jgi:hypothetical protein
MKINDSAYEGREKAGQVVHYQVEMAADGLVTRHNPRTFENDLKRVFERFHGRGGNG